jgi:hypothetical protein
MVMLAVVAKEINPFSIYGKKSPWKSLGLVHGPFKREAVPTVADRPAGLETHPTHGTATAQEEELIHKLFKREAVPCQGPLLPNAGLGGCHGSGKILIRGNGIKF